MAATVPCGRIGCPGAALDGSLWCGSCGVRFLGDPGLLEPQRDSAGRIVGDYRGTIKPGILAAIEEHSTMETIE